MTRPPVEVTLVEAPWCHFCEHAESLLEDLGRSVPLLIRTVALDSEEGRALMVRHRAPFPPILIIDGKLFGHGRISRRRLERHLGLAPDEAVQ